MHTKGHLLRVLGIAFDLRRGQPDLPWTFRISADGKADGSFRGALSVQRSAWIRAGRLALGGLFTFAPRSE